MGVSGALYFAIIGAIIAMANVLIIHMVLVVNMKLRRLMYVVLGNMRTSSSMPNITVMIGVAICNACMLVPNNIVEQAIANATNRAENCNGFHKTQDINLVVLFSLIFVIPWFCLV